MHKERPSGPICLILADAPPLASNGLRTALIAENGVELMAETTDSGKARWLCQELQPDVLLFELTIPGTSPVETVISLHRCCPAVKVLVLTSYNNGICVRSMCAAGIVGYVLKNETPETVIQAIRTVAQGKQWFSASIMNKLSQPENCEVTVTPQELVTLELIVVGKTNQDIVEILNITEKQLEKRLETLVGKLNVTSRLEMAVYAIQAGLVMGNPKLNQGNSSTRINETALQKSTKTPLTEREQQVLRLIVQGLDNSAIADRLHLAKQTVGNCVCRIYGKLQVNSRAEAIIWAMKQGWH